MTPQHIKDEAEKLYPYIEDNGPDDYRHNQKMMGLQSAYIAWAMKYEEVLQNGEQRNSDLIEQNMVLKSCLIKAVEIIKVWHNMPSAVNKLPKEKEDMMWKIYYQRSPEMKPIREALSSVPVEESEQPDLETLMKSIAHESKKLFYENTQYASGKRLDIVIEDLIKKTVSQHH